ncbi:MAG TPA: carbon storage regulator [Pirellulales bacterium]|nr:carbon storage regulator [Pirellulales bacterium]
MLVLTRKIQQQIQIGDSIRITILQVKGNTVRVGIEAPRDVRVMRAELNVEVPASAEPAVAASKPRVHVTRDAAPSASVGFSSPEKQASKQPVVVEDEAVVPVFVAAHAAADGPEWPQYASFPTDRQPVRPLMRHRLRPIVEPTR